jgi:hypothetical protein
MGIAPTNRRAETHGCTIAEIRNGKIVRSWVYWDTGHLLSPARSDALILDRQTRILAPATRVEVFSALVS